MTTLHHNPLLLSAFDISAERGFLPTMDPLEQIPDEPVLNQLGAELPKFLTARQFRQFIQDRKEIMGALTDDWGLDAFRGAMRTLSFAGHAYVWKIPTIRLPVCRRVWPCPGTVLRNSLAGHRSCPMPPMRCTIGVDSIHRNPSNWAISCSYRTFSEVSTRSGLCSCM